MPVNHDPANKPKTGAGRWVRGQSGNPSGRPKSARLAQACRNILAQVVPDDPEHRTYAECIAFTLATKAVAGDVKAAQELGDRAEGKVVQSVQLSPSADLDDVFGRMTAGELEEFAATGALPAWALEESDGAETEAEQPGGSDSGAAPSDEPQPPAELSDRV